jgi:hypothetical protein
MRVALYHRQRPPTAEALDSEQTHPCHDEPGAKVWRLQCHVAR